MEEDDDLEALRLAALQTIKPKRPVNAHRPRDHLPYYRPRANPNLIAIVPNEEPLYVPSVDVREEVQVREKSPESENSDQEQQTIRSKFRSDSESEVVKLDEDQLDFECEGEGDLLELHNDDSLEKLMDEMEQEFNDDSPKAKSANGVKKPKPPSPKEEKKRSLTPKSPYEKRRSPSPRRRSPRRSRSPWLKRSNSPRRRSPRRSITPRRRSLSPRKRSLTPRKRSISPKRRSRSPRYRRPSPYRRSISPRFRRRTPSPRRSPIRRRSPSLRRSLSPRRSPPRLKRLSPRRKRSLTPRRSLSPRSRRRSPHYRSPRRSISPRRRISPRRKRSRSPLPRRTEKAKPKETKSSEEKETKENVVDPKLEARRKKFETNIVVAPTQKKIRLKTQEEEEEDTKQENIQEESEEENINENPLLLRILNRKKINLEEGTLNIKELVNQLNKADKVKTEKKPKRRPILINQNTEDAISEEPEIVEKVKKKKVKAAPILFSDVAKRKKKKVEKVIEIEDEVEVAAPSVKIKEKADEGVDLRAELSRRRAERLKETVNYQPAVRIIQSAIEGAVIGNRRRPPKQEEITKKANLQGRRVRVVDDNIPENDSEDEIEDSSKIGSYGTLRMTAIRSGKR